jgi:hypothetical protein
MINYINNIYHTILTMNVDELIHKLKITEEENTNLKADLEDKTIQLNKYLLKNIKYYENNKELHKQRVKEYQQKTNYKSDYKPTPEQKKEYNKREYLKRKEKLKNEMGEK